MCLRARAQLFKDATWLRSLHGIPLEAALSAAHPHPNLARCSAMRRRGGSSGGDGIWTVTESFQRSLQARRFVHSCSVALQSYPAHACRHAPLSTEPCGVGSLPSRAESSRQNKER